MNFNACIDKNARILAKICVLFVGIKKKKKKRIAAGTDYYNVSSDSSLFLAFIYSTLVFLLLFLPSLQINSIAVSEFHSWNETKHETNENLKKKKKRKKEKKKEKRIKKRREREKEADVRRRCYPPFPSVFSCNSLFHYQLLLEFMKNVHRDNNKSRRVRAFVTFKNALLIGREHDRNIRAFVLTPIIPFTFMAKHRSLHWILSDVC